MHAYVRACVRTCVCACVRACVRGRACMHACACVACVHACTRTCNTRMAQAYNAAKGWRPPVVHHYTPCTSLYIIIHLCTGVQRGERLAPARRRNGHRWRAGAASLYLFVLFVPLCTSLYLFVPLRTSLYLGRRALGAHAHRPQRHPPALGGSRARAAAGGGRAAADAARELVGVSEDEARK